MKTNMSQLVTLNFGINLSNMGPNSVWWSDISPVQFVPSGQVLPPQYHTKNRRQYWFAEQINNWINTNNYWNPWQTNDTLPLQFVTNGLTGVSIGLYTCSGVLISTTVLSLTTSAAIIAPYQLYQGFISLAGLAEGGYYLQGIAGSGGAAATFISEGLYVKADWPDTLLFTYTSSANKQTMVFDAGFVGNMRVKGFFDNQFKPKYKGAFYVDEPQDISILNAIPYEITTLVVGGDDGVPDYLTRKVAGICLLDGFMIEGEAFSMNEGAEWEEMFTAGNPKKYYKLEIRPSKTVGATGATAAGADTTSSIIVSVDAAAFGPNAGSIPGNSQIINVAIT